MIDSIKNKINKNIIVKEKKIIFFLLFFLLIIIFSLFFIFNTNNIDKKENHIANKNTIKQVDLSGEYKNKEEEKLINSGKIKVIKLKTNNFIKDKNTTSEKIKKDNIPKKLILSADINNNIQNKKENEYEQILKRKSDIISNQGNLIYNDFLDRIDMYNKKNKDISIKYNKFKLIKNKQNLINVLANYLVTNEKGHYDIKSYLIKNNINFVTFLQNINGMLSDIIGEKLFKIDIDVDFIKDLKYKKYKNGIGFTGDDNLVKELDNVLNEIKSGIKIKNEQDKKIFGQKGYIEGLLLNKYSDILNTRNINRMLNKEEDKNYNTLLYSSLILEYNIKKYIDRLDEKIIKQRIIEKIINYVKKSNIPEWDKKEILVIFK